jgi:hypothetical protein
MVRGRPRTRTVPAGARSTRGVHESRVTRRSADKSGRTALLPCSSSAEALGCTCDTTKWSLKFLKQFQPAKDAGKPPKQQVSGKTVQEPTHEASPLTARDSPSAYA